MGEITRFERDEDRAKAATEAASLLVRILADQIKDWGRDDRHATEGAAILALTKLLANLVADHDADKRDQIASVIIKQFRAFLAESVN